ncbi:MAG TPA: Rieske 2Fe-2S domain-containing protein [Polyangia bacterium]|nr:Rieske 2Fe-2S domain-containing protein [Polyangia bacterium]
MAKRFPFSPFPTGWFCVAFSHELRAGELQSRTLFGHEVVLYRASDGAPVMLDAYCPHMGAHLGRGGTLDGDCVRCPMHGFRFDGAGACVSTPYGTKVPPAARVRSWPMRESHGLVLAFHDAHDGAGEPTAPAWEVPDLDTDGWTPFRGVRWTLRSHPQETSENSVDFGHFAEVHRYSQPRLLAGPDVDGPHLTARYSFVRQPGALRFLARRLEVEFEARVHGLGYSLVCARVPALGVQMRNLVLPTPTDGEHIDLRVALSIGPPEGRMSALPKPVWSAAARALARLAFREFTADVRQDFAIWENKVYVERPPLAKGDGPIAIYRRWCRQFYPDGRRLAMVAE